MARLFFWGKILVLLLVCALAAPAHAAPAHNPLPQNPLAGGAAAGKFTGTFRNDQLTIELRASGPRYTGTIRMGDQSFPVTATEQGGVLEGAFQSGGQSFAFRATLNGAALTFTTDGSTYTLQKEGAVNPLAGGARSSSAGTGSAGTGGAASVAGGKRYRNGVGIVFRAPSDWGVQEVQGNPVLVPPGVQYDAKRSDNAEVYFISGAEDETDLDSPQVGVELKKVLTSFKAEPQGELERETIEAGGRQARLYSWRASHPAHGRPMALRVYLVRAGRVMLMLFAIGEMGPVSGRDAVLRQVAASLEFDPSGANSADATPTSAAGGGEGGAQSAGAAGATGTPGAGGTGGGLTDNAPQSQQWLQLLNGKLLQQMDSYTSSGSSGGYNMRRRLYLAPNGQFEFSSSSTVSVYVPGASGGSSGKDQGTGRWQIVTRDGQTYLVLTWSDGRERSIIRLDYRNNQTFLDGTRTFVTNPGEGD